jgi:protease IV
MRRFMRFVVGFFAAVGIVTILVMVAAAALIGMVVSGRETALPDKIVLRADLARGLAHGAGGDPLRRLFYGSRPTLRDFVDALERAGGDSRVKGLFLRVSDDSLGLARVQEVRDAITAFRARGKFALAFADTFGELGPGTRPYYLATACDEIWLQPLGDLGLTGLYSETPFFRGTLDLLGITPSFEHRREYKTATNLLTATKMTAPQREEIEALISATAGQIVRGIAAGRKLSEAQVKAAIDGGPYIGAEARAAGLVDRLGYRDEAIARARERAGPGAKLVALSTYLDSAGRPHTSGPEIALIYGDGLIVRGNGTGSLLASGTEMGARRIVRAFRSARRNSRVRAIVFRIDSRGGSVVASETIWRAVARTSRSGKPVIVSMGDVAGSGGYYIAAPADKIVAEPATLTGSIGVLAGKLVLSGLLNKLGITTDSAQFGANAAMFSETADFSPQAHKRLDDFLDRIYAGFKAHVATGRRMTAEEVEAVAKGRVWSGEEAKAHGLVDELGGYTVAFRLAREAANIPADATFKVVVYPRNEEVVARLFDRLFGRGGDEGAGMGAFAGTLNLAKTMLQRAEALRRDRALLLMPELGEPR